MTKARVLVEGTVQGVGYRALVKHIATLYSVKGLIRNVLKGRVEIYCEGDKNSIERLLKTIEVKGNTEDPFNLNVSKIEPYWEGEEGYSPTWKQFKEFEIDYGDDRSYSLYEQESLESFEMAKLNFSKLQNEVSSLRIDTKDNFSKLQGEVSSLRIDTKDNFSKLQEEVSELRSDTKDNFFKLQGEVSSLRIDTKDNFFKLQGEVALLRGDNNDNFQIMEKKYGNISKELVATKEELKNSMGGMKDSVDELKKSIDSLPEKMTDALIKGIKDLK